MEAPHFCLAGLEGGAGFILQDHQKMPQAYSLGESLGAQEKFLFFVTWLFFLCFRTAGPPSRPGGGVVEQLITNFVLGAICIS